MPGLALLAGVLSVNVRGHSAQPHPPGCRPCIGDDGAGAAATIRHTAQSHYVDATPPVKTTHARSAHVGCVSRLAGSVMRSWMCDWQARVEELAGASFNSCLLNLYRDGGDHMGWHSDNEPLYGPEPVIGAPCQRLPFLDTVALLLSTNTYMCALCRQVFTAAARTRSGARQALCGHDGGVGFRV